jgi:hypothetical protein
MQMTGKGLEPTRVKHHLNSWVDSWHYQQTLHCITFYTSLMIYLGPTLAYYGHINYGRKFFKTLTQWSMLYTVVIYE